MPTAPLPLFTGLSAFPITPCDAAGRVDTEAFGRLLERCADAGVQSVGVLGSTGTYMFTSREERKRAIAAAAETLKGRTPIIAGVGAMRTDDACTFARDAQEAGAQGVLLAPVSYTPLTDEEVFQHFTAVAAASDLPLCIYNNPSTTHFSFSDVLLARLAGVATIVAVKNPAPPPAEAAARFAALRDVMPADFALGYSGDWNTPASLLAGGQTWYSVIGGLLPAPTMALLRAAQSGDAARTAQIEALFKPLWDLFIQHISLRICYAAANAMGLVKADPPRPILPLPGAVAEQAVAVMQALEKAVAQTA